MKSAKVHFTLDFFHVLLGFDVAELLHIHGVLLSQTLQHRGLVELLTAAEFFHHASLLELALELLQSSFDVLAFLNRYYDHANC